jgi:hypothetical protein
MGYAGTLKRLRRGDEIRRPAEKNATRNGIHQTTEMIAARRWDLPAH